MCLPSNMSLFDLVFGCKPRTCLDILAPYMNESKSSGGLEAFVEQRERMLREVMQDVEKEHHDKVARRQKTDSEKI